MTEFEDGLWARLVEEHDADGVALIPRARPTGRRPLLVGGGAATVAGATVAAVLAISASTAAPPAYAMTQNADGSITVTINDLATAAPELNAKFASMGIHETVVPVEANCQNVSQFLFAYPHASTMESLTFGNKWLAPGFTGVIAAEQLPNGEVAMMIGAIKPPVPSCYSSQAFTTRQIGDANGVPTITDVPVSPSTPASPGSWRAKP